MSFKMNLPPTSGVRCVLEQAVFNVRVENTSSPTIHHISTTSVVQTNKVVDCGKAGDPA